MALRRKDKGEEVKNLQRLLNLVGITVNGKPLEVDGSFGPLTEQAVIAFQKRERLIVDGIAGPQTFGRLYELAGVGKYEKIRMYESDIHVYTTSPNEFVDVERGVIGRLERLSTIQKAGKIITAKSNCGFFDTAVEHYGTYIDEGKIYSYPSPNFIDFIYYKDGRTEVKYLTNDEARAIIDKCHWAIGTSWCLVKEGRVDLTGAAKFASISNYRNPRTLLGQKKDGSFVIAVVQGRTATSKGVTASHSAQIMKTLGCYNAVNLDGGGSSELIVGGSIMNAPTDGKERAIGSAILVYKK